MAQTSISIRIDEDVKKEVEIILSQIGLTLSSATNVFYRHVVRTKGIPFLLTAVEQPGTMETVLQKGLEAMKTAQQQAITNGTYEFTLDDINDIINECRRENRGA